MSMKNRKTKKVWLLLLGGLNAAAASAQQGDAGGLSYLDEVVVSATRTAQRLQDVPASTTVVEREAIEKSSASTADQLLQRVPGLYAARMSAASPNRIAQVYTRGLPGNGRTLVLVDGVPMNVLFDGQVDWSQLSTQDIERIEVVRGAASGLYGSNAMGGVVSISSRLPESGFSPRLSVEAGSNNTRRGAASVSGKAGTTGYFLSFSQLSSDGYDMWTDAQRAQHGAAATQMTAMGTRKRNAVAKLVQEIGEQGLLEFRLSSLDDKSTDFYDIPGYVPNHRKQLLTSLRYQHLGEAADYSVLAYHRKGRQFADNAAAPLYRSIASKADYDDVSRGVNAQFGIALGDHHRLSAGVEFSDGYMDVVTDRYVATPTRVMRRYGEVRRSALFVQDEMHLGERWVVNLSGRVDRWAHRGWQTDTLPAQPAGNYPTRSGSEFSPRLGVLYRVSPEVVLRANAGRAFKLPELWELYSSARRGAATYWGNAALDPERLTSYDIGVDRYFGRTGFVKVTAYRNDARDFIYNVRRDASNFDKVNVGGVRTRGVEIEARYRPAGWVELMFSQTWNRSTITRFAPDPALEGNTLVNVPNVRSWLQAEFTLPQQSTLTLVAQRVGRRYADDQNLTYRKAYTTFDVQLAHQLTPAASVRLGVENVEDRRYEGIGYMAPGRQVTLALDARF